MRLLTMLMASLLLGGVLPGVSATPRKAAIVPQAPDGMVQVVVELTAQPSALAYTDALVLGAETARIAGQTQTSRVDQAQQRLLPSLGDLGATVLYRTQRAYNGIGLLIPARSLDALQRLPGVRAIHAAVQHQLAYSTNLEDIDAPDAWSGADGGTGTGQKIAIIDTGIDYTHADFGGAGTTAASSAARANPRVVEPGSGFPSTKVAGGIDLVGDDYIGTGTGDQIIPRPDPDPIDCYSSGHGTHVSGIAAGLGVTGDGKTFPGPYTASGPAENLRINPGVAPGALLYAVKIFGCAGSSTITPAAIEWAIDPNGDGDFSDRMDVINMSLGSTFGTSYDASSVAADNAVRAGIVVVTSAGNQGDTYFVTSTPGSADRAISTASSIGQDLSTFSSRGPRRGDFALKPDIAAPGTGIISARSGSGADSSSLSGTSMASPHVAGSAAILRQRHPDWSPEEIKAALLNTAGPRLEETLGRMYSPVRAGAGRLNLNRALHTPAVAFNADDPGRVSISFGAPDVVDTLMLIKNVRVINKASSGPAITYTLGVTQILSTTGITVTPMRTSVTIAPGASVTVPILLSIPDAQALGRSRDPILSSSTLSRQSLNEIAGAITFTPTITGVERLAVGYFAAPRRTALKAVSPTSLAPSDTTGAIALRLSGDSSADPALLSVFELQHTSTMTNTPKVEGPGAFPLGQAADLQYVGTTSDYSRVRDVTKSTIAFGIATYAAWTMPSEVRIEIDLDTNRDGTPEYTLLTTDTGPIINSSLPGDTFTVWLRTPIGSQTLIGRVNFVEPSVDTAPYRSRVLTFGVPASSLGLTAARSGFNYRVRTYHLDVQDDAFEPTLLDQTPVLRYDVARSGITVTNRSPIADGAPLFAASGMNLTLNYDTGALEANHSSGILLLYHNNTVERQAQVVPISFMVDRPFSLFLPITAKGTP